MLKKNMILSEKEKHIFHQGFTPFAHFFSPADMGYIDSRIGLDFHSVLVPRSPHVLIGHLTFEDRLVLGLHGEVCNALVHLQFFLWGQKKHNIPWKKMEMHPFVCINNAITAGHCEVFSLCSVSWQPTQGEYLIEPTIEEDMKTKCRSFGLLPYITGNSPHQVNKLLSMDDNTISRVWCQLTAWGSKYRDGWHYSVISAMDRAVDPCSWMKAGNFLQAWSLNNRLRPTYLLKKKIVFFFTFHLAFSVAASAE